LDSTKPDTLELQDTLPSRYSPWIKSGHIEVLLRGETELSFRLLPSLAKRGGGVADL
jgi:hypothetical protein